MNENRGLRSKLPNYDELAFEIPILPTLYMMCGIVGSGKSTKAVELAIENNAIIHASDNIRKELLDDINSQEKNELVFKILHSRIFNDLNAGKNVIFDATNISVKTRVAFLNQLKQKKIDCHKVCVVMATPYEDCIENNRSRERNVPEEVITRMYKNFEMPSTYEGFNDIQICFNREEYPEYDFLIKLHELVEVSHDNPHHTFSIGNHCIVCQEQMLQLILDKDDISWTRKCCLFASALLHDIGKGFVKEFKNSKGETTEIAHYHQHHCVGAYDSMFYLKGGFSKEEYVRTILLINHHMKPFEWERNPHPDKAIKKFIAIYGEEFVQDLILLHECDLKSH